MKTPNDIGGVLPNTEQRRDDFISGVLAVYNASVDPENEPDQTFQLRDNQICWEDGYRYARKKIEMAALKVLKEETK